MNENAFECPALPFQSSSERAQGPPRHAFHAFATLATACSHALIASVDSRCAELSSTTTPPSPHRQVRSPADHPLRVRARTLTLVPWCAQMMERRARHVATNRPTDLCVLCAPRPLACRARAAAQSVTHALPAHGPTLCCWQADWHGLGRASTRRTRWSSIRPLGAPPPRSSARASAGARAPLLRPRAQLCYLSSALLPFERAQPSP